MGASRSIMPYYDLRLTYSPIFKKPDNEITKSDKAKIYSLIHKLIHTRCMEDMPYTFGEEKAEDDKHCSTLHCHFRFQSHDLEDTIRTRTIKAHFAQLNLECKGNACYKFKWVKPDDVKRFYRYCLKQCKGHCEIINPGLKLCKIDDLPALCLLAQDEYKNKNKYNLAKKVLKKNKIELFDRLKKYLEKNHPQEIDRRKIFAHTLAFYDHENRAFNINSINGHVKRYMWKKKLITADELIPNDPFYH